MLRRILASRGFVSILGAAVVAIVAIAGAVVLAQPTKKRIDYCAALPDSIGLYTGNQVTLRGIKVGTVTDISPDGTGVKVKFRIDADHPLRGDVSAATVSDTVVADRRLALATGKGDDWDPDKCITKTATPKSITQTLDSLSKLASELQGDGDPAKKDTVGQAVRAFDKATSGAGPKLNSTIKELASALRSPDAAIGRIGALIDSLSSLSQSVANGWPQLKQMLSGLAPVLDLVNQIWGQVAEIVRSLVVLLPLLNDITTKYGGVILELVDKAVPFLDLVAANAGTLQKLVDQIPVLEQMFQQVIDPKTGRAKVAYAAPKVPLPQPEADQVCAAINTVAPGKCGDAGGGLVAVDLSTLLGTILGSGR